MNKNFKEVIADIKQGEIWESEYIIIRMDKYLRVSIRHKEGFDENTVGLYFDKEDKFKLRVL